MANSAGPDETAHYELSDLHLHCLQRYLVWFAGMKGLLFDGEIPWQKENRNNYQTIIMLRF